MAKQTNNIPMMAQQIVKEMGGRGNVAQLSHCATRLRVNVADPGKVNVDELKKINGVYGVELAGDYLQVIVGAIIEDLYLAVEKLTGVTGAGNIEKPDGPKQKKTLGQTFSSFLLMMAGIMSPVIPALIAAGFLSTVLTIMSVFFHVDAGNSTTRS